MRNRRPRSSSAAAPCAPPDFSLSLPIKPAEPCAGRLESFQKRSTSRCNPDFIPPVHNLEREQSVMKGDPKVIEQLNHAVFLELGAVNQYWVHYRLLEDWGFQKL